MVGEETSGGEVEGSVKINRHTPTAPYVCVCVWGGRGLNKVIPRTTAAASTCSADPGRVTAGQTVPTRNATG